MGSQRSGANGEDKVLYVPVGTEILDEDQETLIADLTAVGDRVLLAKGGNGGLETCISNPQPTTTAQIRGLRGLSAPFGCAKTDCGCGSVGVAECGQVHLFAANIQCASQNCGLSVHHALSKSVWWH